MSSDLNNKPDGASDDSIQKVHAKLISEKSEPKEGFKTMPLFLLGFVSTMIFVTSIYVVHYRAGFSPMVYDERFDPAKAAAAAGSVELTPEQFIAAGKKSYLKDCATKSRVWARPAVSPRSPNPSG